MGTETKVISSAESDHGKMLLSVTRGLKAIFVPNTSVRRLRNNFAPFGLSAKIIGLPEVTSASTRLVGDVSYLQTKVAESEKLTIMTAYKNVSVPSSAANGCMVAGTYKSYRADQPSVLTFGCSLYSLNNTSISLSATRDNSGTLTGAGITLNGVNTANWGLYSATVDAGQNTLRSHTANLTKQAISPTLVW